VGATTLGDNARIEWIQYTTERPRRVTLSTAARIHAELKSGDAWTGIRFEEFHATGPGELPEGCLPGHVVVINVGSPIPSDVSWSGEPRPTKHFLAPGGVSVFPALMPYLPQWGSCANHQTILVEVASEFVAAVSEGGSSTHLGLRPAFDDEDPLIVHLARALREDLRAGLPSGCLYGETLGTALCAHLLQKHGVFEQTFQQYRGGLPKYQLRHVIEYIDDNLEKAISLPDLARVAQISLYHFVRLFKQSTGLSPHQYVLKKRIEHAKSLLQTAGMPIAEIALRSGFGSQSSFTRAFQRLTCSTPKTYRTRISENML